ncbi:MAG: Rid family hydrolase, partial [Pseudomonadota bacterium]
LRWQDVDFGTEASMNGSNGWVRVQASLPGKPGPFDGMQGADGAVIQGAWEGFTPKWQKARTVPMLPGARAALLPREQGGLYPYDVLPDGSPHPFSEREPHQLVFPSPHALSTIQGVLSEAGFAMADVVRVQYTVTEAEYRHDIAPALRAAFGEVRPASTLVVAGLAEAEMKVEIEVTAYRPS